MGRFLRGEAGHSMPFLALIGTMGGFLVGCQVQAPAMKPLRSVHMEALYTLHPLWSEMRDTQTRVLPQMNPPFSQKPFSPDPVRLGEEPEIQETLAEDRQQHIVSKAEFFRKQYVDSLAKTAVQQIEREVRLKQKELDARFQTEANRLVAQMDAEEEKRRLLIANQIHNRALVEVIYKANAERYVGESLKQTRARLERVQRQLRSLTAERDSPRPDFRAISIAKLASLRKELDTILVKYQRDLSEVKMREIDKTLAKQGIDLKAELEAIPQLAQALPTAVKKQTMLVSLEPKTAADRGAEQVLLRVTEQASGQEETALKESLREQVRRDVGKAVAQVCAQRGWQLVAPNTPKSSDATAELRLALQSVWSIPKEHLKP